MTDVKTGWTIHFALLNKASAWGIHALDKALTALPMGLKGIHSDTGSEFINKPADLWCQRHGVAFSSRTAERDIETGIWTWQFVPGKEADACGGWRGGVFVQHEAASSCP
jgi:hypothetical protein